jgi:hypothetical protein
MELNNYIAFVSAIALTLITFFLLALVVFTVYIIKFLLEAKNKLFYLINKYESKVEKSSNTFANFLPYISPIMVILSYFTKKGR